MGFISKTITIATAASLAGCSEYSLPPKQIIADGEMFYACGGLYVRSFKDGLVSGDTYTVEFTDKFGDKVQLRGIRKVSIRDLSDEATEAMPSSLPDPTSDKDWDGNSFENGTTYRWRDGAATLTDGRWEPANYNRPNLSCNAKTEL